MDVLEIDAELVAVRRADVGEVVDHLRDVLLEVEPRVPCPVPPTAGAEAGDARDRDRRPVPESLFATEPWWRCAYCTRNSFSLLTTERRHHLPGDRVHRVEEVGRLLEGRECRRRCCTAHRCGTGSSGW